jgi:hypothetical protein
MLPSVASGRRKPRWAPAAAVAAACAVLASTTLAATEGAFTAVTGNPTNTFAASNCAVPGSPAPTASTDTFVELDQPAMAHGADGDIQVVSATGADSRGLVKFTLPVIPAGCSVTSAVLRLTASGFTSSGRTLEARTVTSAWNEATVAWNTQASTTTSMATTASGAGPIDFPVTTAQMTAMYASNHGFQIRDSSENEAIFPLKLQDYFSRESATTPPRLTVNYG